MRLIDLPLKRVGIGIALMAMTSAAYADVLVVRSVGPSAARYRPGTTMPDAQKVVLRQGDVLTLLDTKGSWTLQGPVAVAASTRLRNAAAAPTLTTISERRARIGAVRSPEGADGRPNIWLIDITEPGITCIVDAAHPMLWRGDTTSAARTMVTGPDGSTAQVDWAAGQDTHDWPETLPVVPGGSYRLTDDTAAAPTTLTLQFLAAAPGDVAQAGKALIDHGCSAQLDLLVAQSATADAAGT